MSNNIPLAERLRPDCLEDYIGQEHLVGQDAIIRKMIESGRVNSFILWGPPGVGKTTLARIVASKTEVPFYTLSAVTSGVKDVRDVLQRCEADSRSVFAKDTAHDPRCPRERASYYWIGSNGLLNRSSSPR